MIALMNLLASLNGTKLAASGGASLLSFVLVDITTGQAVLAAFFAVVSAGLAAWLASRPALLQARTAAEQQHVTEAEQADARLERVHRSEVQWLQSRIVYLQQQVVLLRQSKHRLSGYIEVAHGGIRDAHAEIKVRGGEPPPFKFKYYDELCGEEDKALAALTLPAEFQPTQTGEMPRMEG